MPSKTEEYLALAQRTVSSGETTPVPFSISLYNTPQGSLTTHAWF